MQLLTKNSGAFILGQELRETTGTQFQLELSAAAASPVSGLRLQRGHAGGFLVCEIDFPSQGAKLPGCGAPPRAGEAPPTLQSVLSDGTQRPSAVSGSNREFLTCPASATPLLSASVLSTAARLAVPVLPPVLGPPPLPSPPRLALQAPQAVRAGQDGGFRDLEL